MAISISTLRTRVFSRLAADLASPTYSEIDNANITIWANELTSLVTEKLAKMDAKDELQALVTIGTSVALSASGVGSLPSGFAVAMAVKVDISGTRKSVFRLYYDPAKFAKWDSSNFILTPTNRKPVALIAGNNVRIKPTSISTAYVDWAKEHPDLASNSTLYQINGDRMLVGLVAARCYDFLEEPDLANNARKEVGF
jgi:hypothetical protein